jgi:hypothetical protein
MAVRLGWMPHYPQFDKSTPTALRKRKAVRMWHLKVREAQRNAPRTRLAAFWCVLTQTFPMSLLTLGNDF